MGCATSVVLFGLVYLFQRYQALKPRAPHRSAGLPPSLDEKDVLRWCSERGKVVGTPTEIVGLLVRSGFIVALTPPQWETLCSALRIKLAAKDITLESLTRELEK